MGKVTKKNKKEDKKVGKMARLLGRGQKGSASIDQPDYPIDAQAAYRAIGPVNPDHLQGCQSWDVKYLGCVRSVRDWQSPGSRTEFMELVDQGQASGFLMLHSFTPKQLSVSPKRMIITDDKRKVSYAEVLLTSVGSLAYAEDDNRHFLGIKTLWMGGGREGGEEGEEKDGGSYCCHVLECDNELMVRQICTGMSEHFQQLLAQQEAKRRQQQQAAAATTSPQQPVHSKMLKKLAEPTSSPPKADQPQDKPEKASKKPSEKAKKPSEKVKKPPEVSKQQPLQAKPAKQKPAKPQKESKPTPVKRQDKMQPVLAGMELGLDDSEFGFSDFKSGVDDVESGLPLEALDQEWILRDWSTHLHSPTTSPNGEILDEIGRQFSAITREPVRARRSGSQIQGPKLKRLSIHDGDKGSLSKRQQRRGASSRVSPKAKADLNQSQNEQLLPPLRPNQTAQHDGNVVTQRLEDTTGVKVPDSPELLVTRSRTRLSIISGSGSFAGPSASASEHTLDQMETSEAPPDPEPMDTSPGKSLERKGSNRSRKSYRLEMKEEGDKETRIDGDASGTVLVQTVVSEKETCIVGGQGEAMLLPARELGDYEREQQEQETQENTSPSPPPPTAALPPHPTPTLPPPPPPPPPKKQREPWPVLVRVDDVARDPFHKSYLHEVCSTMGVIEYRKLRQDWLAYQRCNIDVVVFCKRTKLLFRGDRVHLREGARVLVDPEDQPVFDDVLAGKVVESQAPSSPALPPPPLSPLPTGTSAATPPSRPWSATKPAKPSIPAAATSAPPIPASSTGGLASKLQMFEKSASSGSGSKPVEIEGGISVRKLIQDSERTGTVSESKNIGHSGVPAKPSSVKRFGERDSQDQGSPSSSPRPKPSRGGILSKIAAFEGGGALSPPHSPEPQRGRERERGGARSPPRSPERQRGREQERGGARSPPRSPERQRGREQERGGARSPPRSPERRRGREQERGRDRYEREDRREERREDRRREKLDSRNGDLKKHHDDRKKEKDRSRERKGRDPGKDKHRREEGDERERRRSRKEKDRDQRKDRDRESSQEDQRAGKHRSRRHRSESEERRQRRAERRKRKAEEDSGLDDILATGNKLLGPLGVDTEGTIDALSNLLGDQADEDNILQQAAKVIGAFDQDSDPMTPNVPTVPPGFVPVAPAPPSEPAMQQVPVAPPTMVPVPIQQALIQPPAVAQQPIVTQQPIVLQPQQHVQATQPTQMIAVPLQQQTAVVPQQANVAQQLAMQVQQPAMQAQQPAMQVQQPAMQVQQPAMQVQQPAMQVQQPAMQAQQPAMQVQQPSMQVQQPAMQAQQPLTQFQQVQPVSQAPLTSTTAVAVPGPSQAVSPAPEGQHRQQTPPQPDFESNEAETEQGHLVAQDNQEESESDSESDSGVETPIQGVPPPPPPPVPGASFIPQPPPLQAQVPLHKQPRPPKMSSDVHATRDTMLDEIRKGKKLKSVTTEETSPAVEGDLFAEIRSGKQLKKVPEPERKGAHKKKGELEQAITEEWKRRKERREKRERGGREDEGEERYGKHHRADRSEREGRRARDEDRHDRASRDERERRRHRGEERERENTPIHGNQREGKRGRPPKDSSPRRESSGGYSDDESPKSSRRQPPAPRQRREDEHQGSPKATERSMPAWKAALLRKRQEREMALQMGEEEAEPEPEPLQVRKPTVETYQGIPKVNEEEENMPVWKAALFKKRQNKISEEEEARLRQETEYEAQFEGMPDWKRKLMKQRFDAKAAQEATERELEKQRGEKRAQIMSMPEWKRKLFLERNPKYTS